MQKTEEIKQKLNILITSQYDEYQGKRGFVSYVCLVCGHKTSVRFGSLLQGFGCKPCSILKNSKKRIGITQQRGKTIQEKILDVTKKNITVLTSEEEIPNCKTEIDVVCDICGHRWSPKLDDVSTKSNCPACQLKLKSRLYRKKEQDFKQEISQLLSNKQIICLSEYSNYTNNSSKLNWSCKVCGYEFSMSFNKALGGLGCPKCVLQAKASRSRISREKFLDICTKLLQRNLRVVVAYEDFKNVDTKITIFCENCKKEFCMTLFNVFGRSACCPYCSQHSSLPERQISEFLDVLVVPFVKRDRTSLVDTTGASRPLEIDLLSLSLNFGIEFHGLYWHSTTIQTDMALHHKKHSLAKDAGIDLIQIFEDEYTNNPELVHSIIRAKVDKPLYTYDASSCTPGSITEENLKAFMAANSFESYDEYDARVELGDGGKTLAVLLWRKDEDAIRFKYVVARDTKVVEGLQRLLGTITPLYPNCALETASDARYSLHDKELEACGFTWSHITEPDRFYCVDNYKARIPAVGENVDNLPEIYGVGHNIYTR